MEEARTIMMWVRENRAGLEQGSMVGKARQAQTFEDVVVGRPG